MDPLGSLKMKTNFAPQDQHEPKIFCKHLLFEKMPKRPKTTSERCNVIKNVLFENSQNNVEKDQKLVSKSSDVIKNGVFEKGGKKQHILFQFFVPFLNGEDKKCEG
jgi:hypothetical protein